MLILHTPGDIYRRPLLRSWRSSTYRHWQPFCNWFHMYRKPIWPFFFWVKGSPFQVPTESRKHDHENKTRGNWGEEGRWSLSHSHSFLPATPSFSHITSLHFREPSTHVSSLVSESLEQAKLMDTEQVVRISELTCKICCLSVIGAYGPRACDNRIMAVTYQVYNISKAWKWLTWWRMKPPWLCVIYITIIHRSGGG